MGSWEIQNLIVLELEFVLPSPVLVGIKFSWGGGGGGGDFKCPLRSPLDYQYQGVDWVIRKKKPC